MFSGSLESHTSPDRMCLMSRNFRRQTEKPKPSDTPGVREFENLRKTNRAPRYVRCDHLRSFPRVEGWEGRTAKLYQRPATSHRSRRDSPEGEAGAPKLGRSLPHKTRNWRTSARRSRISRPPSSRAEPGRTGSGPQLAPMAPMFGQLRALCCRHRLRARSTSLPPEGSQASWLPSRTPKCGAPHERGCGAVRSGCRRRRVLGQWGYGKE